MTHVKCQHGASECELACCFPLFTIGAYDLSNLPYGSLI